MNSPVLREVRRDATRFVDRIRAFRPRGKARHDLTSFVHRLEDAYARGWTDCPCVFVLSTESAGSATLAALLACSPRIAARHEPVPRLAKASFDAYLRGNGHTASSMLQQVVYAARDDLVWEASRSGRIYGESGGRLTHLAPVLAQCFPSSKFIHLHRDPFAFVRSALRRGCYARPDADFTATRPRAGEALAETWQSLPRLEKCAWLWSRTNDDASAFLATLPPERALGLRADELFVGDAATLSAVFAFVGVEVPPRRALDDVLARTRTSAVGQADACAGWNDAAHEAVWHVVASVAKRIGYAADVDPRQDPPRRWRDVLSPIQLLPRRPRVKRRGRFATGMGMEQLTGL